MAAWQQIAATESDEPARRQRRQAVGQRLPRAAREAYMWRWWTSSPRKARNQPNAV